MTFRNRRHIPHSPRPHCGVLWAETSLSPFPTKTNCPEKALGDSHLLKQSKVLSRVLWRVVVDSTTIHILHLCNKKSWLQAEGSSPSKYASVVSPVTSGNRNRIEGCSYLCLQMMTFWLLSSSQTQRGNWIPWKQAFPLKCGCHGQHRCPARERSQNPERHTARRLGEHERNCWTTEAVLRQCWTSLAKNYFSGNQQIMWYWRTTHQLIMEIFTKCKS